MSGNSKFILVKNIFFLALLQIVNYVIPLMAWPILTNMLGVSNFGLLAMLFSVFGIANIFTDFGFDLSATYKVSSNVDNKYLIARLLSNIFIIKLILSLFTILGFFLYMYVCFREYDVIDVYTYIIVAFIIFFQSYQCVWLFQGIEKMKYITIATGLSKIGYILLLIIIMPFFKSVNSALFCFLMSLVLVSLTHFICIYKEGFYLGKPELSSLFSELRNSSGFFFSRVAVSVYTSLNVVLLGIFQSPHIAGLYGAAEKLYFAGARVSGILSQALYPNMAKAGNFNLLVKIVVSVFIPFCFCCYIASFFSQDIMDTIFGAEFKDAGKILNLFFILMCITFLSASLGYPGFAAIKKVKLANYVVILGAIFHFIGLVFLYCLDKIEVLHLMYLVIATETIILLLIILMLLYFYRSKILR